MFLWLCQHTDVFETVITVRGAFPTYPILNVYYYMSYYTEKEDEWKTWKCGVILIELKRCNELGFFVAPLASFHFEAKLIVLYLPRSITHNKTRQMEKKEKTCSAYSCNYNQRRSW